MVDTHYIYRPHVLSAAPFPASTSDVSRLLAAAPAGLLVRGFDGIGDPIVTDSKVVLNGDATTGLDLEPLIVERVFAGRLRDGVGFSFCKTNGKPYDIL